MENAMESKSEMDIKYALEIENLAKEYSNFRLDGVSFKLPQGSIMGLIGENGAGKTTVIKLIMSLIQRESGKIMVFGKDNILDEKAVKEETGVVCSELHMPETFTGTQIDRVMKGIFARWEDTVFFELLDRFRLDPAMKIKAYSRGMKMKLAIAVAMSHHARLLILDEPTSGLDPVVRDEILELFLDFIQDEEHSILISSHIVSDLEKIADYITFLHDGKVILSAEKDSLLESYLVVKGGRGDFAVFEPAELIGYRENSFGAQALMKAEHFRKHGRAISGLVADPAGIEDIMLYIVKGERA